MKRYILAVVCSITLLSAAESKAQEVRKYEFRLGWCGYPNMDYENFTVTPGGSYSDTPIKDMFSNYDGHTYMTGNIMASMDFRIKKWFTLSVGVAANGVWRDEYEYSSGDKIGRTNGCIVTVLPQAKFTWLNREVVRMYSSVGLGLTGGGFDEISEMYPAGQIVFLGISVGRRLVGFAEFGSGTMYMGGMIGVGYRF